jgi:hypothetical protein
LLATCCVALASPLPTAARAATIDVGNGPVTSHLLLESPALGSRDYRVHHPGGGDAFALLQVVLTHDPSLTATFFNFGSAANPNYFVNSITWSGTTETNNPANPWFPYWAHWVAGGQAGFPAATPVPAASWTQGAGISSPYRVTAEGSWDALFFSDGNTPPVTVPVPEPATKACLAVGALLLLPARRRKPAPRSR